MRILLFLPSDEIKNRWCCRLMSVQFSRRWIAIIQSQLTQAADSVKPPTSDIAICANGRGVGGGARAGARGYLRVVVSINNAIRASNNHNQGDDDIEHYERR